MQPCEQYTAKEKVISKELERVSTRHNSLLKLGHAVVLQEKYENLRVLEIMRITVKTLRVFRLRQKSALKHLRGFGFAYQVGGVHTGNFQLGVKGPATLNGAQERPEEFGFVSGICSLHSPPPVFEWPWFKNIQNALIFGVLARFFLPIWLKILLPLSLQGFFFFCLWGKRV